LSGEVVYAGTLLTQAPDYLRQACFREDAETLLHHLAGPDADL
jgi:hypothetical protein